MRPLTSDSFKTASIFQLLLTRLPQGKDNSSQSTSTPLWVSRNTQDRSRLLIKKASDFIEHGEEKEYNLTQGQLMICVEKNFSLV